MAPDPVIGLDRIELVEAHHPDRATESRLRLAGNLGHAIGGIDREAAREHRRGIAPAATTELEDARARRQKVEQGVEMAAGAVAAARRVDRRFGRIETQRGRVELRLR